MKRFFALAAALLFAGSGLRAGVLPVSGGPDYTVSRAFGYLEDPGGRMTVDEARAAYVQGRFQPVPAIGPGPNFGLSRSAYWLQVTLQVAPDAPRDWLLELAYPPLDSIELYTPDGRGGTVRQVGGDNLPFAAREVPHRNHVFAVQLRAGTAVPVFLRIASEGTVSAPVRLWRPAALWSHDQAAYATLSLYFGLLLGLLLYNLLLWVSTRDRGYLFYVAFVGCMGIGQAALNGFGGQFLWPGLTWWNEVSVPAGLTTAALFGLLFAREFLSSAARMPGLDRVLLALGAGWAVGLVTGLTLPYRVSAVIVTVLAPLTVALLIAIAWVSIRRGFAGAKYFMMAWALLLLGVVVLTLHNTGVLPSNALTSNALLIGSALEMVLLSFALGDRINVARRFKEQAQARIAAEHAMVEALSQSQDRLKQVLEEREVILENSLVGIAFLTPQGRFKWANRAMYQVFGAGEESVTSMEPFYISRGQYLEVGGQVAAAVARGDVFKRELQFRRRDGTLIWAQLTGKAVNPQDLGQGTVWSVMDITERKQLQQRLEETMSEREALLNNAVVGMVLSVQRRHQWVNEKFAQMLGYPRQVLIGQTSLYLHKDEEAWQRFGDEARTTLMATNAYTCELQLRRRSGELFWVDMGGSCLHPNDPDAGVIWTFLDITQRKKSDAQMREALEQQKALNDLRSRFVAMTSHEFRTPLAGILAAEEVLRHHGDRLSPHDRTETLDSIADGVQRMSRMMDRVLLLGRADARLLDFQPRELDLPALCRGLVDEAKAQFPATPCSIRMASGDGIGRGHWDDKLLRHALSNLLSNAIKYSPAGGEVLLDVRAQDGAMVFTVRDQGIGIPPDEIGHLFGSFHRASNVGAIQGTGLGLAIVKSAVEAHGGHLEVQSQLGRGTTFRIRLPVATAAPADDRS